ncbi:DUF5703 family protein [Rhodococcus sp. HNM0569]|uniref:DUF5703 family protein n=1 Tax=Rhodococcus sp. HNM0569 TaxID=2716340 RepID=UPI001469C0FE|nr:DUF5703 family protein [Rhodococcus sp. HNM0569]NLU84967.1 hypothetical protein [Rhodococcus sp. HNM0569]
MAFNARKLPATWDTSSEEFDYVPLTLPPDVTRVSASMRLAIQAEFGGWELSRVRLYTDGSRGVLLRRRKSPRHIPDPGI